MSDYKKIEAELLEKLPNATQKEIAEIYARLIESSIPGDEFLGINKAILERWSKRGLNNVKVMAWKLVRHGN